MRGYFGVGVEGVSNPMNLGNLVRIAHAFDASFFFSIAPRLNLSKANSDTSTPKLVFCQTFEEKEVKIRSRILMKMLNNHFALHHLTSRRTQHQWMPEKR